MHSSESGVTDHLARDDAHALAIARSIVADLGVAGRRPVAVSDDTTLSLSSSLPISLLIDESHFGAIQPPQAPEEPLYPAHELHGIVGTDLKQAFDMRDVIARIVDGSRFREFKKEYGTTMVTVRIPIPAVSIPKWSL